MEKIYIYNMKYVLKDGTIKTCKQKVKRIITGGLRTGRKKTVISDDIKNKIFELISQNKSRNFISSETGLSLYHIREALKVR